MKHIVKQSEPQNFAEWKRKNKNSSWDSFSKTSEYKKLKSSLTEEQESLCCYCEVVIGGKENTHIEHFKPRSKYPKDIFNYNNLLSSCNSKESCGSKKGNEYFPEMVSPLSDCESRFTYTDNGQVIPYLENDKHAQQTIDLLGLNCRRLRRRRDSVYKALNKCEPQVVSNLIENYKVWPGGFYTYVQYIVHKSV